MNGDNKRALSAYYSNYAVTLKKKKIYIYKDCGFAKLLLPTTLKRIGKSLFLGMFRDSIGTNNNNLVHIKPVQFK